MKSDNPNYYIALTKVIVNYKYIICQQKLNSIYSNVIICFILTPFLTLPSPLNLQNFTTPNRSLMCCVCVCRFCISFTYVIEGIESKLISVFVINDYSLIADLHIFVYGRAEFSSISLEGTKVKLFILNNFGVNLPRNFPLIFMYNKSK